MNKIKWYSLDNILKHKAQYYIIFGERSNGKSYAVDKYIIDSFFLKGEQFGFVKRYEEDDEEQKLSYGLICANSFESAVEDLSAMYGEANLEKISVEMLSWDFSTFEVSKSTYEALKTEAKERRQ